MPDLSASARSWAVRPYVPIPIWIVAFILLTGFRFVASFPASRNSDDANNLLAGMDMVAGNWSLHGWTLAPDNYVPTDVFAQGLASLIQGFRPVLIEAVEAVIWALIALVAVSLTIRELAGHFRLAAAITIVTLVTVVVDYASLWDGFLTGVGSHGSTILLTLLTFRLAAVRRERAAAAGMLGLGSLVLLGSFADPIFVVICALPLLAVCLLHPRCHGSSRLSLLTAGAVFGGVLLSHVLLWLVVTSGGFRSTPLVLQFASFDGTLDHLGFALHSVVALLGSDFFDRVLTPSVLHGPLLALARVPFVLAFALVLALVGAELTPTLRSWPRAPSASPPSPQFLDHLLWMSVLACIAASVVTRVVVDLTCIRFFLPATVAGSILMMRRLGAVPIFTAYASVVSAASIAVALVTMLQGPARPVIASPGDWRLAQALRDHDLHHGYGGYWQSGITTMLTRGDVRTLALIDDHGNAARPLDWFVNRSWYRDAVDHWRGRVFFIASAHAGSPVELSQDTVLRMFGPPMQTVPVDGLLVDIYQLGDHALDRLAP